MTTLALNILDITQNSIAAGATEIRISILESLRADSLEITISDNGSGIEPELLEKVTDPFTTSRTTRKTGMGLPLLGYHAGIAGGSLLIRSEKGTGTVVKSTFIHSHIDRQPLGDISGVMTILISSNQEIDFIYSHKTDTGEYVFSTRETKEFLGMDNLKGYELLKDIRELIKENLKAISVKDQN